MALLTKPHMSSSRPQSAAAQRQQRRTHVVVARQHFISTAPARSLSKAVITSSRRQLSSSGSSSSSSSSSSNSSGAVVAAAAAEPAATSGPLTDDALLAAAIALAKVTDDTKALDISLLHVEPIVSWTSYMLICTVMSKPQLLAVLSRVEDAAAEFGLAKQNSAGSSQWEVLDFGSIVVQVFTAEQRDVYDLDGYYSLAEEVELPFVTETSSSSGGGVLVTDAL